MNKFFLCGVLPFVAVFIYMFSPHDIFKSVGCATTAFVIAVYLSYFDNKDEPLLVDNPLARRWFVERPAAMEAVKTALLKAEFQGYKWRLLQFDPDLGSIKGCLDVLDLEKHPQFGLLQIRREVFLIADFDALVGQTLVNLRFHVRCGNRRDFGTQAVQFVTKGIQSELKGQKTVVALTELSTYRT